MALTTRETIIANPGRKAGKRMAEPQRRRKLSAAQIKAGFGGKRRKSNAARHRDRTPKKAAGRPSQRKRERNAPPKSGGRVNKAKRRRNLGGIFALTGNPARGGNVAK